jgi:threonine/homoserine/homoserine lactone efflux protein
LGLVSLAGGALLLWLGSESWRTRAFEFLAAAASTTTAPHSLTRGVLLNLLNPHPWLFWLMVGVPFLTRALPQTLWAGVLFTAGFYLLFIGSKVVLVLGRARIWLNEQRYELVMRGLGLLWFGFAALLLRDGWQLLQPAQASRS